MTDDEAELFARVSGLELLVKVLVERTALREPTFLDGLKDLHANAQQMATGQYNGTKTSAHQQLTGNYVSELLDQCLKSVAETINLSSQTMN